MRSQYVKMCSKKLIAEINVKIAFSPSSFLSLTRILRLISKTCKNYIRVNSTVALLTGKLIFQSHTVMFFLSDWILKPTLMATDNVDSKLT